MSLIWTDIQQIAENLYDQYPDVDPKLIRFTDLSQKILELDDFSGEMKHCSEKILEAIQAAWIEETE